MQPQGWYQDPYGVHEDRYFSEGQPTKLVRDGEGEVYDPPPPGEPPEPLIEVPEVEPLDGSALLRADDPTAGPVTYDREKAFEAAAAAELACQPQTLDP
jgi:hypothetical protein